MGSPVRAHDDLAWDYLNGLATFDDRIGEVETVLATARAHTGWSPNTRMEELSAATGDKGVTRPRFAYLERLEGSPNLEPFVGDIEQLEALASEDGILDGLSHFEDVCAPVSRYPDDDFWRVAIVDELRDEHARPWRLVNPPADAAGG